MLLPDPLRHRPFAPKAFSDLFAGQRFLLDEDIHASEAEKLRSAKYDAISVRETPHLIAKDDLIILAEAVLDERILVTYDGGHGTVLFRDRVISPPGVILIRDQIPDVASVIIRLLMQRPLQGFFVAVKRRASDATLHIHGRALPESAALTSRLNDLREDKRQAKVFNLVLPEETNRRTA